MRKYVPRTSTVLAVLDYLSTSPSQWVALVGPRMSGKSTILQMVRSKSDTDTSDTIWVTIDMLSLDPQDSFAANVAKFVSLLASGIESQDQLVESLVQAVNVATVSEVRGECDPVTAILDCLATEFPNRQLVLLLENVDLMRCPHERRLLSHLEVLRTRRSSWVSDNLTVIVTSVFEVTAPYSPEYSELRYHQCDVNDFTKDESHVFVNDAMSQRQLTITSAAIDLLHAYSCGVPHTLSSLVAAIVSENEVTSESVYDAIIHTVHHSKGILGFIGKVPLPNESLEWLFTLLRGEPVLPFSADPGIPSLLRVGLLAQVLDNSTDERGIGFYLRNPIVHMLATTIYATHTPPPYLTSQERLQLQLPIVRSAVMNTQYRASVLARANVLSEQHASHRNKKWFASIREAVEAESLPIDMSLLMRWTEHLKHVPPQDALPIVRSLVAKILFHENGGDANG